MARAGSCGAIGKVLFERPARRHAGSADSRGGDLDPSLTSPLAEGRAAQPGSPHGRRSGLPRRGDPARGSEHRRGAAPQPLAASAIRTCAASPPTPAKPVPLHASPGHERGLARRRRVERLGGAKPRRRPNRRRREELHVPCCEGPARQPCYDSANPNICENLYAEAGAVTRRSTRTLQR
jgi:hypothetical protein